MEDKKDFISLIKNPNKYALMIAAVVLLAVLMLAAIVIALVKLVKRIAARRAICKKI